MALPTVTQTWTHSTNNRYVFATVLGGTGAFMFSLAGVGGFLTTTMGYTCKGSCDGTTGAMDGVNRITAANKWATRNNGAAGAQSWIVLTDGAGVDWAFSFNSASDDICRLAHSTAGLYVAAGTPAQQPTATDECFDAASGTWTSATASADRVWNFAATSDKKMWRAVVMRSAALTMYLAGERFTGSLISPATFTLTTGGGTAAAIKSYYNGQNYSGYANATYAVTTTSDLCRLHTAGGGDINCKATMGHEMVGGSTGGLNGSVGTLDAEKPALQGGTGELLFPTSLGSKLTNADGKLGVKFDHWMALTNATTTPGLIDTYGSLQFIAYFGGLVLPWDGVTTPVST